MRVLISAGEASGELYGSQLMATLKRRLPGCEFFGVGGEKMRAAGCEILIDARELSVVGITEVLPHVAGIYRKFRRLVREAAARKPDFAVVIDSPAFNVRVARELHQRGVPVFYYVAPQFWAWRQGRVKQIQKYIRKALVIFPFEEQWYRERGVEAEFVGHPLADLEPPGISRQQFAAENGLDPEREWIAILPGSRRKEVRMNLPALIKAAVHLQAPAIIQMGLRAAGQVPADSLTATEAVMAFEEAFDTEFTDAEIDRLRLLPPQDAYEFVVPVASTLDEDWMRKQLGMVAPGFKLVRDVRAALKHARAAAVASGTATVEAALLGCPFVMVYRVSPLTYRLGKPLVKVPRYAMVNLIAGKEVVPELVQRDFTARNVAARLREILPDGPAREKMVAELAAVRAQLQGAAGGAGRQPAAERAADAIVQSVKARRAAKATG
ncbi:MAG TPA: lipid-A-disaccharide synthase [Terriglobales bacterium]|jgi:lipid-A-disaccharide synthase|nr:lipid-A-disaccharide synthase [Terriglobales bacterium]